MMAQRANRYRNTQLFPKPFHARDFLMNFEREAQATPVVAPKKKEPKSAQELLAIAKRTAMLYNRDNETHRKREQERIERRRNSHTLGTERRTRHGR
jgi:thioredoxin reductase